MKKQIIKKSLQIKKANIAKLNERDTASLKGGITTHGTPTTLGSMIMICPPTFDPIGCTTVV
ncbi:class I lanthipeptide [uncultured Kordia sp.]|uniref:class I lanthipeptide n=1 Tax=uncultured Kordia sp. TaxID=507699 RepID=UPI002604B6B1|nr:class I lanthipeptide [uncultured Kordia sp.]